MQNILDQNLDMATALLAGEKLKELILPGSSQDEKGGALAGLMVQLKLELPFDRVVTIGTVIIPILLVTLVFTRNFAGEELSRSFTKQHNSCSIRRQLQMKKCQI